MQLQKADSVVSKREAINKLRKNSSRSITRKDIMEKDKSVYKQVMFSSGQNNDDKLNDYISLHKRTIKLDVKEPDFEYKIRPVIYCPMCKKNKPISVLEETNYTAGHSPEKGGSESMSKKTDKEKDSLYVCSDCLSGRMQITLLVTRSKAFIAKNKKKYEKFTEVPYLGPFMLFSRLQKYQKIDLHRKESLKKHISTKSIRKSQKLDEITHHFSNYRLLQIDIKEVKCLFLIFIDGRTRP